MSELLTVELVQHRLNYGQYVALIKKDPRCRSRAWHTIQKIFDTATMKEIPFWFRCTECSEVMNRNIKNGTSSLLEHQKGSRRQKT